MRRIVFAALLALALSCATHEKDSRGRSEADEFCILCMGMCDAFMKRTEVCVYSEAKAQRSICTCK